MDYTRVHGEPEELAPQMDNEVSEGEHTLERALDKRLSERYTTDLCCCLLFFMFFANLASITWLSLHVGNPARLFHGFDYRGRLCGVDAAVASEPFVYWPVPQELDYAVCIDHCPSNDTLLVPFPFERVTASERDELNIIEITFEYRLVPSYPTERVGRLFCLPTPTLPTPNFSAILDSESDEWLQRREAKLEREKGHEEKREASLERRHARESHREVVDEANRTGDESSPRFIAPEIDPNTVLLQLQQLVGTPADRLRNAFKDVANAWLLLCAVLPIAMLAGYGYFCLLRIGARALTWTALIALILATLVLAVHFLLLAAPQEIESSLGFLTSQPESARHPIGACFAVVALILCIFVCYVRASVEQAVCCIEASFDALWSLPRILLFPVIDIFVKVTYVVCWLCLFAWVVSSGDIDAPAASVHGTPVQGIVRKFRYTSEQKLNIALYIIGLIWGLETLTVLCQFLIAYTVAVWYFTPKKDGRATHQIPASAWSRGLCVALRYHWGSIAMGGAVVGVFRLPHMVLQFVSRQARGEGNVSQVIERTCVCGVCLFEGFVQYVDKNAVIEMVLSSTNFLSSARSAMDRIKYAPQEAAALSGITSIFQILGTVWITATGAYIAHLMTTCLNAYTDEKSAWFLETPLVVIAVAGVVSYIVASAFMFLVDMTSDTLLFCWLAQAYEEMGADEEEYAPTALVRLLGEPKRILANGGSVPRSRPGFRGI